MLADVNDMSLLPKKVRFVIFYLTILKNFVSCTFLACRRKFGFYGQTRKAILSYITLNIYFYRRMLLPSVPKLSIFQPLSGISSQAFGLIPIKFRILINFSLFDKCLPSPHKLKWSVRLIIYFSRNIVFIFNIIGLFSIYESSEWYLFVKICVAYWYMYLFLYPMWFLFKEQSVGGSQHLHPPQCSHTPFLLDLWYSHTPISTGLLILITFIWR